MKSDRKYVDYIQSKSPMYEALEGVECGEEEVVAKAIKLERNKFKEKLRYCIHNFINSSRSDSWSVDEGGRAKKVKHLKDFVVILYDKVSTNKNFDDTDGALKSIKAYKFVLAIYCWNFF